MTTDPYTDAINAGAAALVKPYRDPDTVSAFVEAFPTIAAARVIEAALPHLRASILTEQAGPGPCPATTEFGHEGVFANGNDTPRQLRALCDLRAGHAGQHEADDPEWGNFRWSDQTNTGCVSELWEYTGEQQGHLRCERTFMHPGYCINGVYVWDEQLNQVLPQPDDRSPIEWTPCRSHTEVLPEQYISEMLRSPALIAECERPDGHVGYHQHKQYVWDDCGRLVSSDGV